jgi:hypothetical protein
MFDSLRRAIFLSWFDSRPEDAKSCVYQACNGLEYLAETKEREVTEFRKATSRLLDEMHKNKESGDNGLLFATVYRWIGAKVDIAQFKLQAETLQYLYELIDNLPPAPKNWPEIQDALHTSPKPKRAPANVRGD